MLDQESRHHPLPCRRIRVNQSAKRAGLAPHDLVQARALLRHKDVVLRAVARAGDDAMLAADALRMERDAAHEECARLGAELDDAQRTVLVHHIDCPRCGWRP